MKILLDRIQFAAHRYFTGLIPLYLESFPQEERRELDVLSAMLNEAQMCFYAVLTDNQLAGLVVCWDFDHFLYIEHLAVNPERRGAGIGSEVLKLLGKHGKPVLLEVEIPYDDASTRRVAFYNRSGFNALPVSYFQPPYREGESLLPMLLFSDKTDWEPETLAGYIKFFQSEVYSARQKG